jgi:subtilase family serine protease
MSIGAVGQTEENAYYGTGGSSMFCTAPGGDLQKSVSNIPVANLLVGTGAGATSTCTDAGEGTSWSAPIVAGCTALMLEATGNNDPVTGLTWYVCLFCKAVHKHS